jgi:hypothetical protein
MPILTVSASIALGRYQMRMCQLQGGGEANGGR